MISSPVSRSNVYNEFSADTQGSVTTSTGKSLLDMYQYIFEPADTTYSSLIEFAGTGQPVLTGTVGEVSTTTNSITVNFKFSFTGGDSRIPSEYEVEVSPNGVDKHYTATKSTTSTTTIQETVSSFQTSFGLQAGITYQVKLKYWNKFNVNNPIFSDMVEMTTSLNPFPAAVTSPSATFLTTATAQMQWTSTEWSTPWKFRTLQKTSGNYVELAGSVSATETPSGSDNYTSNTISLSGQEIYPLTMQVLPDPPSNSYDVSNRNDYWSAPATAHPPPTGVSASMTNTLPPKMNISITHISNPDYAWTAATAGVNLSINDMYYRILNSGGTPVESGRIAKAATSKQSGNLTPNTNYTAEVRYSTTSGDSDWTESNAASLSVLPPTATIDSFSNREPYSFQVNFSYSGDYPMTWRLYYREDNTGGYNLRDSGTGSGGSLTRTITGLDASTTYQVYLDVEYQADTSIDDTSLVGSYTTSASVSIGTITVGDYEIALSSIAGGPSTGGYDVGISTNGTLNACSSSGMTQYATNVGSSHTFTGVNPGNYYVYVCKDGDTAKYGPYTVESLLITASISTPGGTGEVQVTNISGGPSDGTNYYIGIETSASNPYANATQELLNGATSYTFDDSDNNLNDGQTYYVMLRKGTDTLSAVALQTGAVSRTADIPDIRNVDYYPGTVYFDVKNNDHETADIYWEVINTNSGTTEDFGTLEGLAAGTESAAIYATNISSNKNIRIKAKATVNSGSYYSEDDIFNTTNSISLPTCSVNAHNQDTNSFDIDYSVTSSQGFDMDWELEYRESGGGWNPLDSGTNDSSTGTLSTTVSGLSDNTDYDVRISVEYSGDSSLNTSASDSIRTNAAIPQLVVSTPSASYINNNREVELTSSFSGGSGTYDRAAVGTSESNAAGNLSIPGEYVSSPGSSETFTVTDNGTYFVAVRDSQPVDAVSSGRSVASIKYSKPTIAITNLTDTSVTYQVTNNDFEDGRSYSIIKTSGGSTVWAKGWTNVNSGSSYSVTYSSLNASTDYKIEANFQVENGPNITSDADVENFTTTAAAPSAPTGLTVTGTTISWNSVSGANRYLVEVKDSQNSTWSIAGYPYDPATSVSWTPCNFAMGSGFRYFDVRVRAENSGGDSSWALDEQAYYGSC